MTTTNRTHSHSAKKALIALAASAVVGTVGAGAAEARGVEDCQLAWGQAVRSYLTQNRTKGPEDVVFRPACTIESQGDKAKARVEAVVIGVQALVKLDAKDGELGPAPREFYEAKLITGEFYFKNLLPRAEGHRIAMRSGSKTVATMPTDSF